MKNKGFTLIELLAVIVILAIIALIALPMITGVVEKSRKGAASSSALGYMEAVEKQIMTSQVTNENQINLNGTYSAAKLKELGVKVKGQEPSSGTITLENGKIASGIFCIGNYRVEVSNNKVTKTKKVSECSIELKPGLYDENDNLLASWDELVNKYNFHPENYYTYATATETSGSYMYMINNNPNLQSATKLIIGNGIPNIGWYAFKDATLKHVVMSDSITSIHGSAFFHCRELETVRLSSNIVDIGSEAFTGAVKLKSITLPEKLKYINSYTFNNCSSLTEIVIPNSVIYIGEKTFHDCNNLKSIKFDNKNGWYISSDGNTINQTLNVDDASLNATNLVNTYTAYKWKRN